MVKTSMIVATALVLSGSAALAQSYTPWLPAGPGSQTNKTQSAAGAPAPYGAPQAMATRDTDNPRRVAVTDEYGNQYNSRGQRIGHGPAMR